MFVSDFCLAYHHKSLYIRHEYKKSRSHEWLSSNLMNKIYLLTSHITSMPQKKFSKKIIFSKTFNFQQSIAPFSRGFGSVFMGGVDTILPVTADTGMTTSTSSKSRRLKTASPVVTYHSARTGRGQRQGWRPCLWPGRCRRSVPRCLGRCRIRSARSARC